MAMDIFDAIDNHCTMRPYDIALIHPRGALNFLQLRAFITVTAQRLRSNGIGPGGLAAIYVQDPLLHIGLAFGLMLNGTPSVSAHPNNDPMPAAIGVTAYIVDRGLEQTAGSHTVAVDATWLQDVNPKTPFPAQRGFADADTIARITTSSGTTGVPKGIGQSMRIMVGRAQRRLWSDRSFVTGPSVTMMAIASVGGFAAPFTAFWCGAPLVLANGVLPLLRAINLYNIRNLLASPVQLQGLVTVLQGASARFPSLERVEVGGSAIPPQLVLRARATLCPNLCGVYGSTETGAITQAPTATLEAHPSAAGFVMPDCAVRIVDEAGTELPPGTEGIIQVRAEFMSTGYIGDPEATARSFRDGWFLPGDVGTLSADGLLTITGRADELINAGGVKVSPDLIDQFIATQPGVSQAAAFPGRGADGVEQVWVALVTTEGYDEAALRRTCIARLHARAPTRYLRVAELPRNGMGKVMRHKLAEAAAGLPATPAAQQSMPESFRFS